MSGRRNTLADMAYKDRQSRQEEILHILYQI
jgi:hypothetical protein